MNTLILIIYGIANTFLMMWFGYGGVKELDPILHSYFFLIPFYLTIEIIAIYVLLCNESKKIRTHAHLGFLAPWGFILFFTLPQYNKDPSGVLLMVFFSLLVWFVQYPGEKLTLFIQNKRKENKNA